MFSMKFYLIFLNFIFYCITRTVYNIHVERITVLIVYYIHNSVKETIERIKKL